jgi:CheY-like chemotaxis protein
VHHGRVPTSWPAGHVLVVEDEADLRAIVATVLVEEGYQVTLARDGAEAVERLRRDRPDVILLDLRLPRLDGASVLAAYRAMPGPHAPVIAFSALPDAAEAAEDLGVSDVLPKPFRVADLIRLVAGHTRRSAPGTTDGR